MVFSVGMIIPFQGPGGIYGPSAQAVTELAVAEINAAGGILGDEVRVEIIDGGAPLQSIRAQVAELLLRGGIDALGGWHISSVRNALVPLVGRRVPYVYPALYEGGEYRRGLYCTGERPGNQLSPAMRWLRQNSGARRWFVIGDNYVWPRQSFEAVRDRAQDIGVTIVGNRFVDASGRGSDSQVTQAVRAVARSGCDAVLVLMVGQNAVAFNRAFSGAGLHERILRFSPLMEENMLLASGIGATENLFSAGGYFRSLATGDALGLLGRYLSLHGRCAPALTGPAESCYEGLFALRAIVTSARSADVDATDRVIDGLAYVGPRGLVEFVGNQARQQLYLSAASGFDFEILAGL